MRLSVGRFGSLIRPSAAFILACVCLAACGSSTVEGKGGAVPLAGKGSSLPASWVYCQPRTIASLLAWTVTGDTVHGNYTSSMLDSSGTTIDTNTLSFTGVISSSSVTLNLGGDAGSVSGTILSGQLQLEIPDSEGTIESEDLVPGTAAAFNADVAKIQATANSNEAADQQQQAAQQAAAAAQQAVGAAAAAKARRQQAVSNAAQAVSSEESSISNDISTLASDEQDLVSDVSTIQGDLRTVRSDLAQAQSDAKSEPGNVCNDEGAAWDDQSTTEDDQGTYEDDLSSEQSDTSNTQQDLDSLRSDWASLAAAESADPTYVPPGGFPTSSAEASALSADTSALSKYQQTVTADTQTIAGYLSQAKTYAGKATQLCESASA